MYLKVEITHNGQTYIYEGDGFEDAWKALRDAGNLLADHTAAELSFPKEGLEGLAANMQDAMSADDNDLCMSTGDSESEPNIG